MTQEEKELLIKDLSARVHYGLKCKVRYWDGSGRLYVTGDMPFIGIIGNTCVFKTNFIHENTLSVDIAEVKPYLRPMSSMTEEEQKEFGSLVGLWKNPSTSRFINCLPNLSGEFGKTLITEVIITKAIDWLNANHFDYRGLIEKGLALEAKEGMYETE